MSSLKRVLAILSGALAMIAVALLCAFASLRIALHGREVEVPNLAGRTDADAAQAAKDLGLNLSIENRFYSPSVPPNHVLSQSPAPGSRVRRGWQVRVTESLGPQRVSVPDVTGLTDRPAGLMLKRLQLETGAVVHLPAPGPAGIVLAQSPPPNSSGLNGPTVSLLVSDNETDADAPAYIMPSIVGLSLASATLRLGTAGLHIAVAEAPSEAPPPVDTAPSSDPAIPPTIHPPPQSFSVDATIASQSPAPGHRVTRADTIRVTLSH
jgi:eukaryotic-like serine/threonine-protein kinase